MSQNIVVLTTVDEATNFFSIDRVEKPIARRADGQDKEVTTLEETLGFLTASSPKEAPVKESEEVESAEKPVEPAPVADAPAGQVEGNSEESEEGSEESPI